MQSLRSTSLRRICLSVTASVTRRQPNSLLSVLAYQRQSFTSSSTRWHSSTGQFHHQTIEETRETPSEAEEVQREPRSATNTLFIGNLPWSTTDDELREVLSIYGPLLRIAVAKDNQGRSKGYAHVEFESKRDAINTTKDHNESPLMIGDRELRLDYAYPLGQKGVPPLRRAVNDHHEPNPTVFIGNVPHAAKREDIREALKHLGNVVNVRIAVDKGGNSKGFAHVDFANTVEAEKVLEHYKRHQINILDQEVRMDRSAPRNMGGFYSPSPWLYFTNWEGDESSLRSHFGALRSKILDIYCFKNSNPTDLPGTGLIEFRDLETAKEALRRFNSPELTLAYSRRGDRSKSKPVTRRDKRLATFGLRSRKERD